MGVDIKKFINSRTVWSFGANKEEVKSSDALYWRSLFADVPNGIKRIAYLSGPALIDAQSSMNQDLAQNKKQYIFYDKNNPHAQGIIIN